MNGVEQAAGVTQSAFERGQLAILLKRIAEKDAASLKSLYERTSAKLYGICLRLLRDDGEAQDVLQEVYVSVWSKAALFDESRASAITWMSTIARNRSIDRLRSLQVPAEGLESALDIPDGDPSSLEVLEKAEDASRLRHCLEELESRAQTMIRAAFFEGATYPELAKREAVPLATMKSWIRRGLLRLRECLER